MAGDGNLYVTFFNVGLGDSTLIVCPNGKHVLIDAGTHKLRTPGDVDFDLGFNQRTEELRDRFVQDFQLLLGGNPIDVLVLTHPDTDHYNMIYQVLERIEVKQILHSMDWGTYKYSTFQRWLKSGIYTDISIEELTVDADDPTPKPICDGTKAGGPTCTLTAIASGVPGYTSKPADLKNSASVVIKCVFGSATLLLMGDATVSTEDFLLATYPPSNPPAAADGLFADILRVGHHGSPTSTSEDFLDAVVPDVAIISCSRENRHGLPKAEVMTQLLGGKVTGTCENHTVGWYAGPKKQNPTPTTQDTTIYVWETGWNGIRTFGFNGANQPWIMPPPVPVTVDEDGDVEMGGDN